ncbi:MAG: hypothetical protein DHS20C05_01100 [Hyphococcus sp.]|nr:MAG: hypothetical protein DHS20C05_01100 [Marinicaulis sp.]
MTKPDLGVKRDCPECGARFYDLNKEPAHCPKCDHEFVPESLLKPRKTRAEEIGEDKKKVEEEKPEQETSLENADAEKKAPTSKRQPGLDEDDDDEDNEEDDLSDIEDIDIDDDDEEDDSSLLDDDDDDEDVTAIVKPASNDD